MSLHARHLTIALAALLGCGDRGDVAVDGGGLAQDGPLGNTAEVGASSAGGQAGTYDAPSAGSPDAQVSTISRPDASARDAFSGDRGYLPVDPPDGGPPPCIWNLLRQCCGPPELCREQVLDGGLEADLCWSTGERNTVDRKGNIVAYNSDGTICYTQEYTLFNGTDSGMTFYDSANRPVATYRVLGSGWSVEVTCNGSTFLRTAPFSCAMAIKNCRSGICQR